mmetsp:Transcript_22357/g.40198  ORF Transcript_22357/g.40198 Transcript_22357/m.40198 type:complete len:463 (-) Transcript_22357:818-2206(-)
MRASVSSDSPSHSAGSTAPRASGLGAGGRGSPGTPWGALTRSSGKPSGRGLLSRLTTLWTSRGMRMAIFRSAGRYRRRATRVSFGAPSRPLAGKALSSAGSSPSITVGEKGISGALAGMGSRASAAGKPAKKPLRRRLRTGWGIAVGAFVGSGLGRYARSAGVIVFCTSRGTALASRSQRRASPTRMSTAGAGGARRSTTSSGGSAVHEPSGITPMRSGSSCSSSSGGGAVAPRMFVGHVARQFSTHAVSSANPKPSTTAGSSMARTSCDAAGGKTLTGSGATCASRSTGTALRAPWGSRSMTRGRSRATFAATGRRLKRGARSSIGASVTMDGVNVCSKSRRRRARVGGVKGVGVPWTGSAGYSSACTCSGICWLMASGRFRTHTSSNVARETGSSGGGQRSGYGADSIRRTSAGIPSTTSGGRAAKLRGRRYANRTSGQAAVTRPARTSGDAFSICSIGT